MKARQIFKWIVALTIGLICVLTLAISGSVTYQKYKAERAAEAAIMKWKANNWTEYRLANQLVVKTVIAEMQSGYFEHGEVGVFRYLSGIFSSNGMRSRGQGYTILSLASRLVVNDGELKRTLPRAIQEICTISVLSTQPKELPLEILYNRMYLGTNAAGEELTGFSAAATEYFHREVSDLTSAQVALLAAIVTSPARFDPRKHPSEALTKRNYILDRMASEKLISPEEAKSSAKEPLLGSSGR